MFVKNGYPSRFFDEIVTTFSKPCPSPSDIDSSISEENPDYELLSVPYYGNCSEKFAKTLRKILQNNYNTTIKIIYSTHKVRQYFGLKSMTPVPLSSNVVYHYTCAENAHTTYVGYTKRHLITRVREHISLLDNTTSYVKNHVKQCNGCRNVKGKIDKYQIDKIQKIDNFKILKFCRDEFECRVAEALIIKKLRPSLNKQMLSQGASLFLKIFK